MRGPSEVSSSLNRSVILWALGSKEHSCEGSTVCPEQLIWAANVESRAGRLSKKKKKGGWGTNQTWHYVMSRC